MKTKLLKKCRKRFSIEYIESPPNYDCLLVDYFNCFKQPYYLFGDLNYGLYEPFKTKEEAYNEMSNRIFKSYAHMFPKRIKYKHYKTW